MVKDIEDIDGKKKDEELNEELVINAIKNLSFKLKYMKYEKNELEVLTKLKQLVDRLYNKYSLNTNKK